MKIRPCPDCGSIRSLSETGNPKDARCLDCDAPLNPQPLYFKYLGGLIIIILLVLAAGWIILAGQGTLERPL